MCASVTLSAVPNLPAPVLVVEDDPAMQVRIMRILLAIGYSKEAVVRAATLKEARQLWDYQPVALALIDLGLPDGDGQDLIRHFAKEDPGLPIVVVTAWGQVDIIISAIKAGATGYLLKEREDLEIQLALRNVLRGGAPIDPFVARRLLNAMSGPEEAVPPTNTTGGLVSDATYPGPSLSPREIEILNLVALGLTNREMAERLNLSRYTIECHIKRMYRKLAVKSRTQALHTARLRGLLS